MPTRKCTTSGKSGIKYGTKGKCYAGTGAKAKVARQRAAIHISQGRKK